MLKKPSHNSGEDDAKGPRSWDFAIAIPWRPGWHVTLFPLGLLATAIAFALVLGAILAVIWFLL